MIASYQRALAYVILDERGDTPVPTNNPSLIGALLTNVKARRVAWTELRPYRSEVTVSTVFLVLDHAYGDGPPVLWETLTFSKNPRLDGEMRRYCSRAEAEQGHAAMVEWAARRRKQRSRRRMTVVARRIARTGSPWRRKARRTVV